MRLKSFAMFAAIGLLFAFAVQAQAYTETVIHSFCKKSGCKDGEDPDGGLTRDGAGHLYGITTNAPPDGSESVYMLSQAGSDWSARTLHQFKSAATGQPIFGVVTDGTNLYGVTTTLIYKLSPPNSGSKWTFQVLHRFCTRVNCSSGYRPFSGLSYHGQASGLPYDGVAPLYGTTDLGGAKISGVVYALTPNGNAWDYKVIFDFCDLPTCSTGTSPFGGVLVTDNALYGATEWGGDPNVCGSGFGCGVVYQLTPKAPHARGRNGMWKQTVLYKFCRKANCTDGEIPTAPLAMDGAGNLIGTTQAGGTSNEGTIFKIVPNGANSTETVLHSFCQACGDDPAPSSGVTIDADGSIFGETYDPQHAGTIYRLTGSTYTTLYQFCALDSCKDGAFPTGGLLLDSSGDIFGVTFSGGANSNGTVFEVRP